MKTAFFYFGIERFSMAWEEKQAIGKQQAKEALKRTEMLTLMGILLLVKINKNPGIFG